MAKIGVKVRREWLTEIERGKNIEKVPT